MTAAVKLIGPRTGCQFFKKNVDFSDTYPLKGLLLIRNHCIYFRKYYLQTLTLGRYIIFKTVPVIPSFLRYTDQLIESTVSFSSRG